MKSKLIDAQRLNIILVCSAFVLLSSIIGTLVMNNFKPIDARPAITEPQNLIKQILSDDKEIRGMWIATVANINFPSFPGISVQKQKAEIDSILSTLIDCSMNTVIFQVRPSSDALYPSEIFPSSEFLTGSQGAKIDFDILDYLIKEAHKLGIAVCAWINPLRVSTSMNSSSGDYLQLSQDNPAYRHPEYCVKYGNELYYDPGQPEVRKLVCDGIRELVGSYPIDAVVFDDYFYPYPRDGLTYDDSVSYAEYGGSLSLEDWRRENVNSLVKESYDAVKSVNNSCYFGISPFGIWSNDDGTNNGSATSGLSAYNAIYCDAKSWIEGGYIDFISPQLYWNFESAAAPYDVLCDWWDNALSGSDIPLIVSHGAYRVEEWGKQEEIQNQVEYARNKASYLGSAMYGYSSVYDNSCGVAECLKELYN